MYGELGRIDYEFLHGVKHIQQDWPYLKTVYDVLIRY